MCVHATQYGTKYHTNYHEATFTSITSPCKQVHQIASNCSKLHDKSYKSIQIMYICISKCKYVYINPYNHTSFKQGKSQFRWCHQFHILHVISFWVLRPRSNLSGITLTLKETTNKTESIESFWVFFESIYSIYFYIYINICTCFFLWFFV